jgi:hypothetical protein
MNDSLKRNQHNRSFQGQIGIAWFTTGASIAQWTFSSSKIYYQVIMSVANFEIQWLDLSMILQRVRMLISGKRPDCETFR